MQSRVRGTQRACAPLIQPQRARRQEHVHRAPENGKSFNLVAS